MATKRLGVFVSYSHADKRWLEQVQVHLKPLTREDNLDLWDDTRIKAGEHWREEIKAALERANVAVLLLSANYFASDFIANNELPSLLEAAKRNHRLEILAVHIAPSLHRRHKFLSEYQTVNSPREPITALRKAKRETVFHRLAERIQELLESPPPGPRVETARDQIGFRYSRQFTPERRVIQSPYIRVFAYSRAPPLDEATWEYSQISASEFFSEWFHEEEKLKELRDEWRVLLDNDVYLWKGRRGAIDVEGHPYLKSMSAFIVVSRVDRRKLPDSIEDPRSHVVLLFLTWARELCKLDPGSEFILHDLMVNDQQMYLHGDFIFRNIKGRTMGKHARSVESYVLSRKVILVDCREKIYNVATGVPHPADDTSEYTEHVERWLSEFQLGHR